MPRIPTYQPGSVSATPLPDSKQILLPTPPERSVATVSPDMFGAQQGKDMEAAGRAMISGGGKLMDIAIDEAKLINADMVTRAETSLKEEESQYRVELSQRKGINAATAREDASKWYDDQRRKHMEGLENDAQRRAMMRIMSERRATLLSYAGEHQSRELQHAWAESKSASINASINAAAAANGDPTVLAQERSRIDSHITDMSQRMGWDKIVADGERQKYYTTLHGKVLTNLIDRDPRQADAYLKQYGGEMEEGAKNRLADQVRKGVVEKNAEDIAGRTQAMGLAEGVAVIDKNIEKAREIADPKEREDKLDALKKAKDLHRKAFAEKDAVLQAEQRSAAEQAYTWMRQNGGKLPPLSLRNKMDPHAAFTLEESFRKKGDGEGKVKTDWGVYSDLRKMAREEPDKFAKLDLYRMFGKLADKEREGLLDLQQQFAKGNKEKIDHVQTLETFITNYAADNKLYSSGSTKQDYYNFENTVKDNLERMAKSKGKKVADLTDADRREAADQAVMKVTVKGGSWFGLADDEMPAYKAREKLARTIQDVPEKERQRIRDAYKAKSGALLADRKLIELYNAEKVVKK